MSLTTTMLLGFIAGVTILLGLPIGRLRKPAPSLRALLNATAIGILLFLVWDVFSAAWAPIDEALASVHEGKGGLGTAAGYGVLFAAGLSVGLLSLVYYESWMTRQFARAQQARSGERPYGPGAAAVDELKARRPSRIASWSAAQRLSLLIAVMPFQAFAANVMLACGAGHQGMSMLVAGQVAKAKIGQDSAKEKQYEMDFSWNVAAAGALNILRKLSFEFIWNCDLFARPVCADLLDRK